MINFTLLFKDLIIVIAGVIAFVNLSDYVLIKLERNEIND
jgi:hypothetical protein